MAYTRNSTTLLSIFFTALVLFSVRTNAQPIHMSEANPPPPPTMEELQNIERELFFPELEADDDAPELSALPFDIRGEAIREAALSLGARGGLAYRTYEIRLELETRVSYLDKVFDFSHLLIPAPSGLLIEPPVISESLNALIINGDGQQAAVSDRVLDIISEAKIVSSPKSWRNYLERDWGEVAFPPDLLRPADEKEREQWKRLVEQGWDQGVDQAEQIFESDLNELVADYQGMVRYRMLLTQNMVSPPYAFQLDRGVTGGGNNMRVGDRAIHITGKSELVSGTEKWHPANR